MLGVRKNICDAVTSGVVICQFIFQAVISSTFSRGKTLFAEFITTPKFKFNKIIFPIFIIALLFGQSTETAYLKYYKSDRDFIADIPMLATQRKGLAHLVVTYNENKQPVMKRWLNNHHNLIKEEMVVYSPSNTLEKRVFLDQNRRSTKIIVYSQSEPWSVEFRKYVFQEKDMITISDQQTEFLLDNGELIQKIIFRTIDLHEYGTVLLRYDHLGFLKEEEWRTLPDNAVVRKFVYDFDIIQNVQKIWEYGKSGEIVSHVALSMAPADKLYTTPPPRTGNILDEVDLILRDVVTKGSVSTLPAIIPHTEWDRLSLLNGDEMNIVFIEMGKHYFRFTLPNESDILSMPLKNISTLTSKYGKRIYP